jgi:hypothetical protein
MGAHFITDTTTVAVIADVSDSIKVGDHILSARDSQRRRIVAEHRGGDDDE